MLLVACSRRLPPPDSAAKRSEAAKTLFEQTTRSFHIPSAEAKGAEKSHLQEEAIRGYARLVKEYPEQEYWAAQSLRSMGNIYATQTNVTAAVAHYSEVERRYPRQEWEVLMAWKSAGDLLYEVNRREEAKEFYRKIVQRFDTPEAAQVVKTVVRGSRHRLDLRPG
jgi:tetratricopeptide (TPR) repeat protein